MRPAWSQAHGADIYHANGRPKQVLDFSNTVAETGGAPGWKRRLSDALEGARRYPQPRSLGLAAFIAKALRVPKGAVLVGNGSSDCLDWAARALAGRRVLVETPSFGGYGPKLERAGCQVRRVSAGTGPHAPEWEAQKKALRGAAAFWMANPSNPAGRILGLREMLGRLKDCSRLGVGLLVDEAVGPQALIPLPELASRAARKPGLLLVRSLSKGLGLPGLRLGYVVGHPSEIKKLAAYQELWSVNTLAQASGAWIFSAERKQERQRRSHLSAQKRDLQARLAPLSERGWVRLHPSQTGCFLLELILPHPDADDLGRELEGRGCLVRSCASYGPWGRRFLRLNPRRPAENARLVSALAACLSRLTRSGS